MDFPLIGGLEGGVLLGLRNLTLVGLGEEGQGWAPGLLYKGRARGSQGTTIASRRPNPETLAAQAAPLLHA